MNVYVVLLGGLFDNGYDFSKTTVVLGVLSDRIRAEEFAIAQAKIHLHDYEIKIDDNNGLYELFNIYDSIRVEEHEMEI